MISGVFSSSGKTVQNDFVYLNHLKHDWMDKVSVYPPLVRIRVP